jgi:hypothetical protein
MQGNEYKGGTVSDFEGNVLLTQTQIKEFEIIFSSLTSERMTFSYEICFFNDFKVYLKPSIVQLNTFTVRTSYISDCRFSCGWSVETIYYTYGYCDFLRFSHLQTLCREYCDSNNLDADSIIQIVQTKCEDQNYQSELIIYPSPTLGPVTLKGIKKDQVMNLLDIKGARIKELNYKSKRINQFNFSDLPNGFYVIQYQSGDQLKLKKFLVRK